MFDLEFYISASSDGVYSSRWTLEVRCQDCDYRTFSDAIDPGTEESVMRFESWGETVIAMLPDVSDLPAI